MQKSEDFYREGVSSAEIKKYADFFLQIYLFLQKVCPSLHISLCRNLQISFCREGYLSAEICRFLQRGAHPFLQKCTAAMLRHRGVQAPHCSVAYVSHFLLQHRAVRPLLQQRANFHTSSVSKPRDFQHKVLKKD